MYLRISKHVECCVVHKEPFESAKFEKIIKRRLQNGPNNFVYSVLNQFCNIARFHPDVWHVFQIITDKKRMNTCLLHNTILVEKQFFSLSPPHCYFHTHVYFILTNTITELVAVTTQRTLSNAQRLHCNILQFCSPTTSIPHS